MVEVISPLSVVFTGSCLASLAALLFLFQRHVGGTPLLPYEPRRRVPWGISLALIALVFPFMGVFLALTDSSPEHEEQTIDEEHTEEIVVEETSENADDSQTFIVNGLATIVFMIVFVGVVALFLQSSLGADSHDLGLPSNQSQFMSDVGIGILACLASILPIYIIQFLLVTFLQPVTEHPLIEELQKSHTPAMMLLGLLMVTVAAPLSEEFAFRLLLQGWLEKMEDEAIGYAGSVRPMTPPVEMDLTETISEDITRVVTYPPESLPQEPVPLPRRGLLSDLPHGWLPILISGTIFGLAHFGHGVSPIPLVLFGIVLGYLYQRTHRLVPSITAHALFNAYSMTMLWLNLK